MRENPSPEPVGACFERLLKPVLERILAVVLRRAVWVVALSVGLAVVSWIYAARHLDFLTGQNDLISPQNPLIRLSRQLRPFENRDDFVVVIKGRDREQALAFLRSLVPVLSSDPRHFRELFYRLNPDGFRPWALMYLSRDELERLVEKLDDHADFLRRLYASPDLNTLFDLINREMTARMVGEVFTGFLEEKGGVDSGEPMDLSFLVHLLQAMEARLEGTPETALPWGSFFGTNWKEGSEEGYFWTDNGCLLAFVTPRRVRKSFNNTGKALKRLRAVIQDTRRSYPGIQVGVTGREALDADEMSIAFSDMTRATVWSLAGLTLLLVGFWRSVRRPLLEVTELVIALSWTVGLATLFVGHLNILSVVFAPLLLGLGIDYGIHWLARFEERSGEGRGESTVSAVRETHREMAPGILLSGACAALSFLPLVITGFRGLMELGVITAVGMVMTVVTTTCVLPALVLLFERPSSRRSGRPLSTRYLRPSFPIARGVVLLALGGMVGSLFLANRVRFDLNVLRMQPASAESVVWEHRLIQGAKRSALVGSLVVRSLEEVRRKSRELDALPEVSEVLSVLDFLPSGEREKRPLLREIQWIQGLPADLRPGKELPDLRRLEGTFSRILFKMRPDAHWGASRPLRAQMAEVRRRILRIRKKLERADREAAGKALKSFERSLLGEIADRVEVIRENLRSERMRIEDLPAAIRDRYVAPGPRYLVRIYPRGDVWEPSHLGRFVRAVRSVDPRVVGDPVTLYVFTRAFRRAGVAAAAYAVVGILLFLFVVFRRPVRVVLAFVPLFVGTVWTLGVMGAVHLDFNLANSLFLPLIIGAGVEYGILIVLRWREEDGLPSSTVKSVTLSALTTTVGFGTLMFSRHNGIHSLGVLATVGSLCILGAAVFVLPALMRLLEGRSPSLR